MIEAGLLIAIGLVVTFCKLSWRNRLRMLSHPVLMDAIVFTFLIAIHWGTFTGVMAATIGALVCSLCLSLGRYLYGYMKGGLHVPGKLTVKL